MNQSYRRSPWRAVLIVVVVGLVALARALQPGGDRADLSTAQGPLADGPKEQEYYVVRVVDGDTIIVSQRPPDQLPDDPEEAARYQARVRLLGIDTPETVKPDHPVEPFGEEASDFTKKFLAGGVVRLRLDRRRLDKYDRWLAYVYVGEKMLNEELCRQGLATVYAFEGDSASMTEILRRAETEAEDARRGVWSSP